MFSTTALLLLSAASLQAGEAPPPFLIGGAGGAYFLAEPGVLEVQILKRDRNTSTRPTEMRAILFGPDRQVVAEGFLPPSGGEPRQLGPEQWLTLAAPVDQAGIYGLNLTFSNDRYGTSVLWGFHTNCPRYLIETARGHRDRRHEEPILLLDADRPGQVCFRPRAGEFTIDLSGVTRQPQPVTLLDGAGTVVASLTPGPDGKVSHTVPADPNRGAAPWRLQFARAWATVEIDGLTRWGGSDPVRDQAIWTPDPATWFNWHDNRWLITPYRQAQFGEPGSEFSLDFTIHNNAFAERAIELAATPGATLSARRLTVPARSAAVVTASGRLPATASDVRITVTPADDPAFTTYASLQLKTGVGPTADPLTPPLTLRAYDHENPAIGYHPAYPLEYEPYFDLENRPFVRTAKGLASLTPEGWVEVDLAEAVVERIPDFPEPISGVINPKIAFDADNDVYLLAASGRRRLLLHSNDRGQTFRAYTIPGNTDRGRTLDLEQFSGHNVPAGPPAIAQNTNVPTDPDPKLFWRRVNELDLFVPVKRDGRIVIGEPIRISPLSLGLSGHSGTPSSLASRGDRVHIIWGEATEPGVEVPGVPTFVATYDRTTGRLTEPALIGYGPPANDVHNTPSLTIDGDGYLHALTGTHGRPFHYARSLVANDAGSGWTEAEPTAPGLSQTYIGLVCSSDGTLHLVYRLWRSGIEPFPLAGFSSLTYQRKRPGEPWEAPQPLVVPVFSDYCVFYHRLTVDRAGALYLSHHYWTTHWFYRNDQFNRQRAVITSPDGGNTWRYW